MHVQVALNGVDFGVLDVQQHPFEYYAPIVISSVVPLGGVAEGGTTVTIHGRGFRLRHTPARAQGAADAPKCLFGNVSEVGWAANESALGTTIVVDGRPGGGGGGVDGRSADAGEEPGSSGEEPRSGSPGGNDLDYLLTYLPTYLLTYFLTAEPGSESPGGDDADYSLTYLLTYLPTYLLTAEPGSGSPGGDDTDGSFGSGGPEQGSGVVADSGIVESTVYDASNCSGSASCGGPVARWSYLESSSTDEIAICVLPRLYGGVPGASRPLEIAIAINGQDFSTGGSGEEGPITFTVYDRPRLDALTPSSGPAVGDTRVRIHGHTLDALFLPGEQNPNPPTLTPTLTPIPTPQS